MQTIFALEKRDFFCEEMQILSYSEEIGFSTHTQGKAKAHLRQNLPLRPAHSAEKSAKPPLSSFHLKRKGKKSSQEMQPLRLRRKQIPTGDREKGQRHDSCPKDKKIRRIARDSGSSDEKKGLENNEQYAPVPSSV